MGLDFSTDGIPYHEDFSHRERASFTYGVFGYFRRRLAAPLGITLYEMEGFGGDVSWEPFKDAPLYPLLNHSDCDGRLSWQDCAQVYPALIDAVANWPKHDPLRELGLLLANHMRFCSEIQRDLLFK